MTWTRGQSGNPSGRRRGETPRGAFRRQVETALPDIVKRLVQEALQGDIPAARLILDRVLPPLRPSGEYIKLKLPDLPRERAEVFVQAVAAGTLTPDQGATLMHVMDGARALAEHDELLRRLNAIETWMQDSGG